MEGATIENARRRAVEVFTPKAHHQWINDVQLWPSQAETWQQGSRRLVGDQCHISAPANIYRILSLSSFLCLNDTHPINNSTGN